MTIVELIEFLQLFPAETVVLQTEGEYDGTWEDVGTEEFSFYPREEFYPPRMILLGHRS